MSALLLSTVLKRPIGCHLGGSRKSTLLSVCRPLTAAISRIQWFSDGAKSKQPVVKKKKAKEVVESERTKELNVIFAALDASERKEPPVSEAERARRATIGRNYTIGRFRFHNEIHHDLTNKLHLKKHAMKMLPRHGALREEALKDNDEMPPSWRPIPVWTPPIPGFDPSLYNVKEDN